MHVGIASGFANHTNVDDRQFIREEMTQLLYAAELGFESIWMTEHHFSEYSISPNPLQYLTWLAASRFNRFHLALGMQYNYGADRHGATDNYLCFAYPFLFDVDGYDVRAAGVGPEEQKRNLETLRFIAAESRRRGLKFQLGLWNHAYDYGRDSVHRYPITGIGPSMRASPTGRVEGLLRLAGSRRGPSIMWFASAMAM